MRVAKIIVDIPLMQTDKPYSYAIPEEFAGMLEAGMRVHVPFGKGNRLIQGLIVAFGEEEPETAGEEVEGFKDIAEVLDFSPVLNEEQLWLADQLRKSVFSFKISILKAMLPSLLNSSYDKILYATEELSPQERESLLGRADSLRFSDLDKSSQARAMRLTRSGKLRLEYQATDKKHIKTEKWYQVNHAALQDHDLPRAAKKKQALKEVLLDQQDSRLLADLRQNFSRDIVHYFVKEGLVIVEEREVSRSAAYFQKERQQQSLTLNAEQAAAVAAITEKIGQPQVRPVLLEGVTGSGKTEVYLQVIAEALAQRKTAIMLVPEISLTPQVTDRFISRFGNQVAILHSGLSDGEKYDEWR
ncbi:DEAD/DEAH box helicase family protein, partial [Streptococcus sp. DD11]|uniref:primosomal protein N' family DNA-binding protein n=1 Tax=Streptococcus sp. DD11 TaxID=1777879 RepID=UPI0010085AC4